MILLYLWHKTIKKIVFSFNKTNRIHGYLTTELNAVVFAVAVVALAYEEGGRMNRKNTTLTTLVVLFVNYKHQTACMLLEHLSHAYILRAGIMFDVCVHVCVCLCVL